MAELNRTVIWEGKNERLLLLENLDGSLALMRSTDIDDGPTRSCPIPADALPAVSSALLSISLNRAMYALAASLRDHLAQINRKRA